MSAFGAKRKARKISVVDDDDNTAQTTTSSTAAPDLDQGTVLQATFKTRKPIKQSSLRKSINFDDAGPKDTQEDDDDGGEPLRIRPLARSKPKRASSSRLSFGPGVSQGGDEDDDAMVLGDDLPAFTPAKKNNLAASAVENSAIKRGIARNSRLPVRPVEMDDDRPRYSKEYLAELQNSTPNSPANISSLPNDDDDIEMSLDPSELEGATIVETTQPTAPPTETKVPTASEIAEKKARRVRFAQEAAAGDFISFSDDERGAGDSYLTVLTRRQPSSAISSSKKEKRLAADDNLDDEDSFFVDDGGLSLGRKAEREARRKRRADMASLIDAAEGADGEDGLSSDDSEAERRAAYERAQTRAGMDGLAGERASQRQARLGAVPVPARITPLPDLSVLVGEFKEKMGRKQAEIQRLRARIEELRAEKEGIGRREPEVQQLLNEAGERYKALMGSAGGGDVAMENGIDSVSAAKSFLEQAKAVDTPSGRGLDSLGTTPVRSDQMEM